MYDFIIHALKTIAITRVLEHQGHETLLKISDRSGTPDGGVLTGRGGAAAGELMVSELSPPYGMHKTF